MSGTNRLFDDFTKVAGGAAGTLSGLKTEVESRVRQMLEDAIARLDVPSREDVDAAMAVAAAARSEQEKLTARLAELEAEIARLQAKSDE